MPSPLPGLRVVSRAAPPLAAAALTLFAACTPPEPPPPRPAPVPVARGRAQVAEEDPQAVAARRTDGLQGGELVFHDDFERAELGADWTVRHAGEWTLEGGLLRSHKVDDYDLRNQGVWLNRPLPAKVRVELKARSLSQVGDFKCEIFATEPRHEAGYSIIFGGWNNTINTIARQGEHEPNRRIQSPHVPVEPGRTYTWSIVRTDDVVRWYVDGKFMLAYDDPNPVRGKYFGFNNWLTDVRFDELKVYAL